MRTLTMAEDGWGIIEEALSDLSQKAEDGGVTDVDSVLRAVVEADRRPPMPAAVYETVLKLAYAYDATYGVRRVEAQVDLGKLGFDYRTMEALAQWAREVEAARDLL